MFYYPWRPFELKLTFIVYKIKALLQDMRNALSQKAIIFSPYFTILIMQFSVTHSKENLFSLL